MFAQSPGDIRVSTAAESGLAPMPAVSFRRGRMAHRHGPYCGRQLRIANASRTVARRIVWLVEAWLVGVAFFSLRSAGGFLLLERKRRQQSSVVSERVLEICYTLQDRCGVNAGHSVLRVQVAAGSRGDRMVSPIVFSARDCPDRPLEDQLQAVIAHELAHIRRLDAFVNVFQVCVETLLFYHPAVWWLNKRIRAEREHCCDDIAVSVCGNAVEYARALTLMEEWRSAPFWPWPQIADRSRTASSACSESRRWEPECAASD